MTKDHTLEKIRKILQIEEKYQIPDGIHFGSKVNVNNVQGHGN